MSSNIPIEILSLPTSWSITPNQRTSKRIEKFTSKQQELHNKRIAMLREEMTFIKTQTNEALVNASNPIKSHIDIAQKKVDDYLEKCTFDFSICTPRSSKTSIENKFKYYRELILHISLQLQTKVKEHHEEVLKIEVERMSQLKVALRQCGFDLDEIGHQLPQENEMFLETEMMLINQELLSNQYGYIEINEDLLKMVVNLGHDWMKRLTFSKRNYNATYEHMLKQERSEKVESSSNAYFIGKITAEKIKEFTDKVAMEIYQIECEFTAAINAVYATLDCIHKGHYDEMHQIEASFTGIPRREFLSIYNEVYSSFFKPIVNFSSTSIGKYIGEEGGRKRTLEVKQEEEEKSRGTEKALNNELIDELSLNDNIKDCDTDELLIDDVELMMCKWEEVVSLMTLEVEFCQRATIQGLHVWDAHFYRQAEACQIFSLDLWDMINKLDHADDVHFLSLHQAIDNLRMSEDENHLKANMGEVKRLMGVINNVAEKNLAKELKYVDKLKGLLLKEANIIYLEMLQFVKCIPMGDDVNPTIFRGRRSKIKIVPPEMKPLLMKEFEADIKAMHNWLYGIGLELKNDVGKCTDNALRYVRKWTDSNYTIAHRQYKLKTALMADWWQAIFHQVYRVRLAEIIQHQNRLDQHLAGASEGLNKLTYTDITQRALCQFKSAAKNFQNAIVTSETQSICKQLETLQNTSIATLKTNIQDTIEANTEQSNQLLALNIAYISSMALFSESGNYHITEIDTAKSNISKVNKAILQAKQMFEKNAENDLQEGINVITALTNEILSDAIELSYHEFFENHKVNVKKALEAESIFLVEKRNRLTAYCEKFTRLAAENIGNMEYLAGFNADCEMMQSIFKDLFDLIYEEVAYNVQDLFNINWNHLKVLTNYMSKILLILMESLDVLQKKGEEFFWLFHESSKATQGDIDSSPKAKLKDFMAKQMETHLDYQRQCKQILMEVNIIYIFELDSMVTFLSDYLPRSLEYHTANLEDKLQQTCSKCRLHVRKIKQALEDAYRSHIAHLKPLHGHPRNRNLLDELDQKLSVLEDFALTEQAYSDEIFAHCTAQFEIDLAECQNYADNLEATITSWLDCFLGNLRDNRIYKQLKESLIQIDAIEYYANTNRESTISKLKSLKQESQVSSKWLKASQIQEKYSCALYNGIQSTGALNSSEIINKFQATQEDCLQAMEADRQLTDVCKKWEKIWKDNVETVEQLYKLKYVPD